MKIGPLPLTFSTSLLLCCLTQVQASVTDIYWWSTCSTLTCDSWSGGYDSSGNVLVGAHQSATGGGMAGTISTDTAVDPTLTLNNAINNDTGFDWTSYVVDVFMSASFTLGLPLSPVSNPSGWAATISIAPYQVSANQWMGEVVYFDTTGVTPVTAAAGPNNELDFAYKVTFSGATSYSLTEQVTAVPEPGTAGLLAGAGLLLGRWLVRRRRAGV